jgi:hypothetical protein
MATKTGQGPWTVADGPGGFGQLTGYPVRVSSNSRSHDEAAQQRLWAESERLTGVTFPV